MARIGKAAVFLLLAALVTARPGQTETPDYSVLKASDGVELRAYAPMIVAEADVPANARDPGGDGFRMLAGYIFGGNDRGAKIAMTSPVTRFAAEGEAGPVWTTQFMMPSKWTREALPAPDDPRVRMVEAPARALVAVRYRPGAGGAKAALEKLDAWIEAEGLTPVGPPIYAGYNPPWTPAPFRRDEILRAVEPAPEPNR